MTKTKIKRAFDLFMSGDLEAAQLLCSEFLHDCPDDIEALHLLGILEAERGDLPKALEFLQRAIFLDADSAFLHNNLGNVLKRMGKKREARYAYEKALDLDANCVTAHNNLANILSDLGDEAKALCHYREALLLKPNYIDANYNLGLLLAKSGDDDGAMNCFLKVENLDPMHIGAKNQLGQIFYRKKQIEKASAFFQDVLKIDPDYVPAIQSMGAILAEKGDFSSAIFYLQSVLDKTSSNYIAMENTSLAAMHDVKEQGSNGHVVLVERQENTSCNDIKNSSSESFYNQENFSLRRQNYDEERRAALQNLGSIYLQKKDLDASLQCYHKLLEREANFDVYYNIGVIYMYKGRLEDALNYFAWALKMNPNNFALYNNLGSIYLKLNDYQNAIFSYKEALRIAPDSADVSYILAALESNEKNLPQFKAAPKEYLQHLFDQYADNFDKHLTCFLDYRVPENLYSVVAPLLLSLNRSNKFSFAKTNHDLDSPDLKNAEFYDFKILDLGCGTGLSGERFKKLAQKMVGIDISTEMLKVAAQKEIYDELHETDIVSYLATCNYCFDFVVAADTLVYSGDLDAVFKGVSRVLNTQGYFAFTVEKTEIYPYVLQKSARFAHAQEYIFQLSKQYNFSLVKQDEIFLRQQKKIPVIGNLYVFKH